MLVIGLFLLRPVFGPLLTFGTVYSKGFSREQFDSIVIGDSFESVTNKVGYPFRYTIESNEPGIFGVRVAFTNAFSLAASVGSEQREILLEYTKPRWNESYRVFSVSISNKVVIQRYSYIYWD
jgi:hypothetical protein